MCREPSAVRGRLDSATASAAGRVTKRGTCGFSALSQDGAAGRVSKSVVGELGERVEQEGAPGGRRAAGGVGFVEDVPEFDQSDPPARALVEGVGEPAGSGWQVVRASRCVGWVLGHEAAWSVSWAFRNRRAAVIRPVSSSASSPSVRFRGRCFGAGRTGRGSRSAGPDSDGCRVAARLPLRLPRPGRSVRPPPVRLVRLRQTGRGCRHRQRCRAGRRPSSGWSA